jgi:hypothetical protein
MLIKAAKLITLYINSYRLINFVVLSISMQYNEITVMNLDSHKGPQDSVFGQEQLQLKEENQTGMKLFSI